MTPASTVDGSSSTTIAGTTIPPVTTTGLGESGLMVDTIEWVRAPEDPDRDFRSRTMTAVTAGDDLLVATGTVDGHGVIWSSPDGLRWGLADVPAPPEGQRDYFTDVVADGSGFVAVGYSGSLEDGGRTFASATATVWTSSDGQVWERLDAVGDAEEPREFINAVAVSNGEWVAVGGGSSDDSGGPLAWTSSDGRSWAGIPREMFGGFGGGESPILHSVVGTEEGFVAVGSDTTRPMPWIWTSWDGSLWEETPSILIDPAPDSVGVVEVAASESAFVMVSDGAHRFSPSAIWTSIDAIDWTVDGATDDSAEAQYLGLATSGTGIVVVGSEKFVGVIWTSTDGETWNQSPRDPDIFGSRTAIHDVTIFGDQIIAVGSSVGDYAVWLGPRRAIDNDYAAP